MHTPLTEKTKKILATIAFGASLLIGVQILLIVLRGEAACLNEGCKVVESLTAIPPLYFNLIGFIYFQTLFWVFFIERRKPITTLNLTGLVLLAGLGVEGVLLAYQIFVAKTFCSYCLAIFTIVLLMNGLAGRRQLATGSAVLAGIIFISSLLSYGPTVLLSKKQTLNSGTYGVRTCLNPAKELYLFFSANCPHCHNVIKALEGCNSCSFHFNPIEQLNSFELDGITPSPSYDPEVNRLLLKLLGINTIPVLLEKTPNGFSIIKGETHITSYIEQACYQADPLLYLDTTEYSEQESVSVFGEEGECSMTIDCDEPEK